MEKVRLAFVGAGNIAGQHLDYIADFNDTEISGFYDIDNNRAERRQNQFGGQTHRSVDEMLDKLRPDAVYICLPPYAHGEAELTCTRLKIPFLVEKPLSNRRDVAREILGEVTRSGTMTSSAYMNRYRKGVQEAKRYLAKYPASLVTGNWMVNAPEDHPWLTEEKLSGGQLVEQTTHIFDLIRYLCGEISEVHCYGFSGAFRDNATTVSMTLESGAVASVQSSWSARFGKDIYLKLLGPEICVEFSGWNFNTEITCKEHPERIVIPGEKNIFAIEDRAFIEAVKKNEKSRILSDYEEGIRSLEISFAAIRSCDEGRPVDMKHSLKLSA